MNILIYNENKEKLLSLNIDIIKQLEGCYSVDEIGDRLYSLYFKNVILDITSIEDYNNFDNLQKLANKINVDNIIIFLGDTNNIVDLNVLKSKLISLGINKITSSINDIEGIVNN